MTPQTSHARNHLTCQDRQGDPLEFQEGPLTALPQRECPSTSLTRLTWSCRAVVLNLGRVLELPGTCEKLPMLGSHPQRF